MIKRIAFFLLFLVIIACKKEKYDIISPQDFTLVSAVPMSAALILETSSLDRLKKKLSTSNAWKAAKGLNWHKSAIDFFTQISTVIPRKDYNQRFIISYVLSGAHSFDYLLLKYVDKEEEKEYVRRLKTADKENVVTYDYVNLYTISSGKEPMYFAIHRNIFLLSRKKLLVEEGIRQLNAKTSLLQNANFNKLYKSANQSNTLNIFIQYAHFNDWAKEYLPDLETDWVKFLADESAFEIDFSSDKIKMKGITYAGLTKAYFFSVFHHLEPHKKNIIKELPLSTAAFFYLSMDNYKEFSKNYNRYLDASGTLFKRQRNLKKYKKFNPVTAFEKWVGDEAVVAYLSVHKPKVLNKLFFVKVKDRKEAKTTLTSIATLKKSYRGYEIYQSHYKNILKDAFGNYIDDSSYQPYFIFKGNIVVFGNSLETLKTYINDILLEKYFVRNESHHRFIQRFDSKAHIFAMGNGIEGIKLIYSFLNEKDRENYKENETSLAKINYAGIQLNFESETGFTEGFITTEKEGERHTPGTFQLWNQSFKGKIKKIYRVTNYKTRQQEVVVEDDTHTIYWISHSGEKRWKKALNEPILGTISQMDIFRNGRLQLVFNTASKLYVLDQNGKEVRPFPIKLTPRATAGMGLFDYDKQKNYRILVPQGGKMTMYNQAGQIVKGFDYTLKETVNRVPKHIRVNQKDYLVTTTKEGKILILSRVGKVRVNVPQTFDIKGDFRFIENKIVFQTKNHQTIKIGFNGQVARLNNNLEDKFTKSFSKGVLHVLNDEVIFKSDALSIRYDLEEANHYKVDYFEDSEQSLLIIIDDTLKQVTTVNEKGRRVAGFPIFGEQNAYLYKEGDAYYIITQSNIDNSVICYKVF